MKTSDDSSSTRELLRRAISRAISPGLAAAIVTAAGTAAASQSGETELTAPEQEQATFDLAGVADGPSSAIYFQVYFQTYQQVVYPQCHYTQYPQCGPACW